MAAQHTHVVVERNWMLPYAVTWYVLSLIALALRLYSRWPSQLGLDDFFVVVAKIFSTPTIILSIQATTNWGYNRHFMDVPPALWPGGLRVAWMITIVALLNTTFIKISVLLFYRRIVRGVNHRLIKWSLWAAILFVTMYLVAFLSWSLSQCTPLHAIWMTLDPTYTEKYRCIPMEQFRLGTTVVSSLSVVTDFVTVTLPAILLFTKVQIKFTRNQRIGLLTIFGLGYLVVLAGIFRTLYLQRVEDPFMLDKTWQAFNALVAGVTEGELALICACAPSLNHLFGRIFRSDSDYGSKSYSGSSSHQKRSRNTESNGVNDGDLEEADMRSYGKTFLIDQTMNSSDKNLDAGYGGGNVRTVCDGPA